ncbi:uncharacterized protein LOC118407985 [Branchiostoma floridae]|uniref:Uncharacterized protein LOC118407985 n=1 Tax=Branchiostoma floridae TaxID=7739 RepID=A0A9J7KL71_BRAFL|nr:uncharacterized protein LOC118407985 [Branchiostoma floridae]
MAGLAALRSTFLTRLPARFVRQSGASLVPYGGKGPNMGDGISARHMSSEGAKGGVGDDKTSGGFFFNAEKAFSASLVFRGQAEKIANDGKPFDNFMPLYYQVDESWTNYTIQVDVSEPIHIRPDGPIGPIFPPLFLEMTVHWGPAPATPELKNAMVKFLGDSKGKK